MVSPSTIFPQVNPMLPSKYQGKTPNSKIASIDHTTKKDDARRAKEKSAIPLGPPGRPRDTALEILFGGCLVCVKEMAATLPRFLKPPESRKFRDHATATQLRRILDILRSVHAAIR